MNSEDRREPRDSGESCKSETPDSVLLSRLRDGSDDAATTLYLRYADRLLRLADKMVYDDVAVQSDREGIVQSVFRTFFRRVSQGQYSAVEGDDLWRLMLAIAMNKIRTTGAYHRAGKRNVARNRPLSEMPVGTEPGTPNEEIPLLQLKMTIQELMQGIPTENHSVILLRIEGHDVESIASRTGRAKRSIERILQQFRQRLESTLNEDLT